MYENLLTLAQQAVGGQWTVGEALPAALHISGIALVAIFFVMGLFGSMIALLARVFPDGVDESE